MTAWFKDNFKWPSLVVWGTSFALVYLIPPAWLRALPGVAEATDWIPHHLPGIGRHVEVSEMPELASVYFPLMTLMSPLIGLDLFYRRDVGAWFKAFGTRPAWSMCLSVLLGATVTVCLGLAWLVARLPWGPSPENSPFLLALLGPAYPSGGAALALVFFLRAAASLNEKEHRHEQASRA